jgi:polysaccharide deacetylase 2 family uncharacterized protein YibQ
MKIRTTLWLVTIVIFLTGSAMSIMGYLKKNDHEAVSDLSAVSADVSGDVYGPAVQPAVSDDMVSDDENYESPDVAAGSDVALPTSTDAVVQAESRDLHVLAIVIDDFGYSMELAEELADLDIPVTWSIIPETAYSTEIMDLAVSRDIPFLIHVPMQAVTDEEGGPYLIGEGMDYPSIRSEISRLAELFPKAAGINNHRGSRATSDPDIMIPVLDEIASRGLAFLDSRTSSDSVAYSIAREKSIPSLYNSVFLDHIGSRDFMSEQFEKAKEIASRCGWVVAICHVRPETVKFLSDLCIKEQKGVEFFTVPELLKMLMEHKEVS